MSDHHISLIDPHINASDAERAAQAILRYLIDNNIVEATPSDCVLSEHRGYRPGPNYITATDISSRETDASNCNYGDFIRMHTNGLEICTHSCVAYDPQAANSLVSCPHCQQPSSQDENWRSAVSAWLDEKGQNRLNCTHCGQASPITSWDNHGEFALGHLALTFWNWPPLSSEFVTRISAIAGNPLLVVTGKL